MDVAVGMDVSVGSGVKVAEGMGEAVNVGMGVKVSVKERLVGEKAGAGEAEAGFCPVLLKLQAHSVNIKIIDRISFLFFMV